MTTWRFMFFFGSERSVKRSGARTNGEWAGYLLEGYDYADFPSGSLVLDVGCGWGRDLGELSRRACVAVGLDLDRELLLKCRQHGLTVFQGRAEEMPIKAGTLDGLVCRVVVPYTDEAPVVAEIGRVLKAGGMGRLCYVGAGY